MTITDRKPAPSLTGTTYQRRILDAWKRLDDCFEMRVADTPELLEQVYRLRFQVYCREKAFEQPVDGGHDQERDAWDRQSRHLLIRHRRNGTALATARLVLMSGDQGQDMFPVERHIGLDPSQMARAPWYLPRRSLAEVSRFAISRTVRRQLSADGMIPKGIGDAALGAWVTLNLVKGLVGLSGYHGIDHWYCFMEGGFFRLLRRLGLHFQPSGDAFDFHGRRFVSLDSVAQILAGMRESQPALFARMGFGPKEGAPALPWPCSGEV